MIADYEIWASARILAREMLNRSIISHIVPTLRSSESGENAIGWMRDLGLRHLPIVNDRELLGVVSEDDILNFPSTLDAIGAHALELPQIAVYGSQHFYEAIKLSLEYKLSIVPVIDKENLYIGSITIEDLYKHLAESASLDNPGAVVILDIAQRDYSLAEISRIAESEGVKIMSMLTSSYPNSSKLDVTLKLNTSDIARMIATFERFEYVIKDTFFESDYLEDMQDRYESLLHYLNV